GDGMADIIVGAGPGGGPHVKVFDGATGTEMGGFFAYIPAFKGGVSVSAADFNNDGLVDIVTGAGPGGGPHVKVVEGTSFLHVQANGQIADSALLASFFAYGPGFTGGVFVSAHADFANVGAPDLVTGAGPGAGPHVKVINGAKLGLRDANGQISDSALFAN